MPTFYPAQNIRFYIPQCCYLQHEASGWHQKILACFEKIKGTQAGKRLFESIAHSPHTIELTTHPIDVECEKIPTTTLKTRALDPLAAKDPHKGSSSQIFIHPGVEGNLPLVLTYHHFHHCEQKLFTTKECAEEGSPCVKREELVSALFHELAHAHHNQLGLNCNDRTHFIKCFKNLEESYAIEKENEMNRELQQPERYGHMHAQNPEIQEHLGNNLAPAQRNFLLVKVHKIFRYIEKKIKEFQQQGQRVLNALFAPETCAHKSDNH